VSVKQSRAMSRPMTRSILKKAAAPPPIPAASRSRSKAIEENEYDLSQADESEYDQEFVEYDGKFHAEFEDEDDSEFEKLADEEEDEFFPSEDENAIMGSFSDEEEQIERELPQNPLEMLSDLALLTNNYGRIDLSGFANSDIWLNEEISVYPTNEIRENPGPRNIPDDADSPNDFFKLLFTEEMMEALCNFTNS
jgi:hypothetical protein